MSELLVVDCSFIMSGILPEDADIWKDIASYSIYVPGIFYLECISVLNSALKRKRINQEEQKEYLNILYELPIQVDKFSSTAESIYSINKLCSLYGLTSYDAGYLELSLRLNARLATKDSQLIEACNKAKVLMAT